MGGKAPWRVRPKDKSPEFPKRVFHRNDVWKNVEVWWENDNQSYLLDQRSVEGVSTFSLVVLVRGHGIYITPSTPLEDFFDQLLQILCGSLRASW